MGASLLVGALLLAAAVSAAPSGASRRLRRARPTRGSTRRIVALAHAGGEDENPHSTLYAFGQAAKAGVSMLDLDLQITSDGVPVVIHNTTVDSTTNGTGTVSNMTFAQVHALDAAYWFTATCSACHGRPVGDYIYRGIRTGDKPPPAGYTADDFGVASLEEVFQRFPNAYFDMEIKDDGAKVPELAQKVADLIHQYHLSSHVMVASFGQPGMDVFRAAAPDVATSATLAEAQAFFLSGTVPQDVQVLDLPPFYDVSGTTVTVISPAFVQKAHDAGLAVWVWMDSGNEQNAAFYGQLVDMGVDGINASRPSVLTELLRSRGVLWDPNAPVGTASTTEVPTSLSPTTTTPYAPTTSAAVPAPATPVPASPTYTG